MKSAIQLLSIQGKPQLENDPDTGASGQVRVDVNISEIAAFSQIDYLANLTTAGTFKIKDLSFYFSGDPSCEINNCTSSEGCDITGSSSSDTFDFFSSSSDTPDLFEPKGLFAVPSNKVILENIEVFGHLCSLPFFMTFDQEENQKNKSVQVTNFKVKSFLLSESLLKFNNITTSNFVDFSVESIRIQTRARVVDILSLSSSDIEAIHNFKNFTITNFTLTKDNINGRLLRSSRPPRALFESNEYLIGVSIFQIGNSQMEIESTLSYAKTKLLNLTCSGLTLNHSMNGITFFKIVGFLDNFECQDIFVDDLKHLSKFMFEDVAKVFEILNAPINTTLKNATISNVETVELYSLKPPRTKIQRSFLTLSDVRVLNSSYTTAVFKFFLKSEVLVFQVSNIYFENVKYDPPLQDLELYMKPYGLVELGIDESSTVTCYFRDIYMKLVGLNFYSTIFGIHSSTEIDVEALKQNDQKVHIQNLTADQIFYIEEDFGGIFTHFIHLDSLAEVYFDGIAVLHCQNILFAEISNTPYFEMKNAFALGDEIDVPLNNTKDRTDKFYSDVRYMITFIRVRNVQNIYLQNITTKQVRFLGAGFDIKSTEPEVMITILDSVFQSNSIFFWTLSKSYTSVFLVEASSYWGKTLVANCTFEGNRVYSIKDPSGISTIAPSMIISAPNLKTYIRNSNFIRNFFAAEGSSKFSDIAADFNDADSMLTHNIWASGSGLVVSNCYFGFNGFNTKKMIGFGSAIRVTGYTNVSNTVFESNIGINGVIYFESNKMTNNTFKNVTFLNNVGKKASDISFEHSNLLNNTLNFYGCSFSRDESISHYYYSDGFTNLLNSFILINSSIIHLHVQDTVFSSYPYIYKINKGERSKIVEHKNEYFTISSESGLTTKFLRVNFTMKNNEKITNFNLEEGSNVEEPEVFSNEYASSASGQAECDFLGHSGEPHIVNKSEMIWSDVSIDTVISLNDYQFKRYQTFFNISNMVFKAINFRATNVQLNTNLFGFYNSRVEFTRSRIENVLATSIFFVDDQTSLLVNRSKAVSVTTHDGIIFVNPLLQKGLSELDRNFRLEIVDSYFSNNFGERGSLLCLYMFNAHQRVLAKMKNVTVEDSYGVGGGTLFVRGNFKIGVRDVVMKRNTAFIGAAVMRYGPELKYLNENWKPRGLLPFSDHTFYLYKPIPNSVFSNEYQPIRSSEKRLMSRGQISEVERQAFYDLDWDSFEKLNDFSSIEDDFHFRYPSFSVEKIFKNKAAQLPPKPPKKKKKRLVEAPVIPTKINKDPPRDLRAANSDMLFYFSDNLNFMENEKISVSGCEKAKIVFMIKPEDEKYIRVPNSDYFEILRNTHIYEITNLTPASTHYNYFRLFQTNLSYIQEEYDLRKDKLYSTTNKTVFIPKFSNLSALNLTQDQMDHTLKTDIFPGLRFLAEIEIGFYDCFNHILVPQYFKDNSELKIKSVTFSKNDRAMEIGPENILVSGITSNTIFSPIMVGFLDEKMREDVANRTVWEISFSSKNFGNSYLLFQAVPKNCPSGYSLYNQLCQQCPSNKYSIQSVTPDSDCLPCPPSATCKDGKLFVNEGYWRSSNTSVKILKCRKPDSCKAEDLENMVYEEAFDPKSLISRSCFTGYIGAQCYQCDTFGYTTKNGSKFFDNGDCTIVEKGSTRSIIMEIGFLAWSFFSLVVYILFNTYVQNASMIDFIRKSNTKRVDMTLLDPKKVTPTPILKIFMIYFSVLRFILFLVQERLPNFWQYVTEGTSNSFDGIKIVIDYFLVDFINYTPILNFYVLFFVILLVIFTTFSISIVYYFVYSRVKKDKLWGSYVFTTFLVFYLFTAPDMVYISSRNMLVFEVDTDKVVNFYSPSILSNDSSLLPVKIISSILLFLVMVAIPLYFVIRIRLALINNQLRQKSFFIKYSYYYKEFRDEYYYFEILRVYIKMSFSFLTVLPGIDTSVKLMILLIVFALYYLMILKVKPYKHLILNNFDRVSGMVFLCTIFGCLVILHLESLLNEETLDNPTERWEKLFYKGIFLITSFFMFAANLYYVMQILIFFYSYSKQLLADAAPQVSNFIDRAITFSRSFRTSKDDDDSLESIDEESIESSRPSETEEDEKNKKETKNQKNDFPLGQKGTPEENEGDLEIQIKGSEEEEKEKEDLKETIKEKKIGDFSFDAGDFEEEDRRSKNILEGNLVNIEMREFEKEMNESDSKSNEDNNN